MDYRKFYNEQEEYTNYRYNSLKQKEYEIISEYKADTLIGVVSTKGPFDDLLEIGCAHGVLLNKIATKLNIKKVTGIDIATENIELAKKAFPEIAFFCGTIENFLIEYPNKKFDLVILSDIIEHIPDDLGFLKSVSRITKYLIINLPLEKCYNYRNRIYGETDSSGHLRNYNINDAFELFNKADLRLIKYRKIIDIKESTTYRKYLKKGIKKRLGEKTLIKRIYWYLINQLKFFLIHLPIIYRILYGYNLFAFVKTEI